MTYDEMLEIENQTFYKSLFFNRCAETFLDHKFDYSGTNEEDEFMACVVGNLMVLKTLAEGMMNI